MTDELEGKPWQLSTTRDNIAMGTCGVCAKPHQLALRAAVQLLAYTASTQANCASLQRLWQTPLTVDDWEP